jgi:hypothetical protein
MAGAHINYQNRKSYTVITEPVDFVTTNCTGVQIENKGTVTAYLKCEGVPIRLKPGEALDYSNDPDVWEVTEFSDISFENQTGDPDIVPEAYLFVTKEVITPFRHDEE